MCRFRSLCSLDLTEYSDRLLGILRCREIGTGAKLLYGRLCLFAGKNGECFVDREELAREMGLSVATIGRQLEELVKKKFIRRVRRGQGQTALCQFLWHEDLETCQRGDSDAAIMPCPKEHSDVPTVREQEPSDRAEVSHQNQVPDSSKVSHQDGSESSILRYQESIQTAQECAPDSAILRRAIKEEKIPLKDSLTPVVVRESSVRREPLSLAAPLEGKIANIAREIHDRHPAVRRCGPAEVRKLLRRIVAKARSPDRPALLDTINENHRLWCSSYRWTKSGGEFAKGLDNWLAPKEERYLAQPAQVSPKPPSAEYQSAEEYLRRVENE